MSSSAVSVLYEAKGLPLIQNRTYDSRDEARACGRGDVRLVESLKTGLVFNAAFDDTLMTYDEHYQNEQAVSALFRRHLDEVAKIVARNLGTQSLIEVGCGKGFFLEMLASKGFAVTGFDPTYEGANPDVVREHFRPGVALNGDGLILRHVLEHVWDPVSFLFSLKEANQGRGRIYIEVPCFDWICERRAWFDIFYEHVNYFRLADFRRMFGIVHEEGRLFGRQYLYTVAELSSLREPKFDASDRVNFPANFLAGLQRPERAAALPSVVWGGSSKGVIFSILEERARRPVSAVVDINPAKQGRFLPVTGLRVQSPKEMLESTPGQAVVYVMNSNYLQEIRAMSHDRFRYVCVDREASNEAS